MNDVMLIEKMLLFKFCYVREYFLTFNLGRFVYVVNVVNLTKKQRHIQFTLSFLRPMITFLNKL